MTYSVQDTLRAGNICTTKAGLGVGTTTTLTTANASLYCIGGKAYSKAAASNAATPTTDAVTGAAFRAQPIDTVRGNVCAYLVGFDASGNMKVVQGKTAYLNDVTGGLSAVDVPMCPDSVTPVAIVEVYGSITQAAAWTFGSSNFAGPPTGVSFVFTDIMMQPAQPLTT